MKCITNEALEIINKKLKQGKRIEMEYNISSIIYQVFFLFIP